MAKKLRYDGFSIMRNNASDDDDDDDDDSDTDDARVHADDVVRSSAP